MLIISSFINIKRTVNKIKSKIIGAFILNKNLRHKYRAILSYISLKSFFSTLLSYLFIHPKHFKYYLSLTICVKDEAEYIIEWLEYYLIQGVDHFYIYNNNGTDNTKEIIKDYIDKGIVTWTDYPGHKVQEKMYNDSIAKHKYETKWMGFIDIDEFIVPLKDKDLKTFMTDFEDYNQIYINWVMYGSSGHKTKTKGLVIERFTKHQKGCHRLTKVILNPRSTFWMLVHIAYVFGKTVNENKQILKEIRTPLNKNLSMSINRIKINHYVVKSYQEFIDKKTKRQKNSCFDILKDDGYFYGEDQNANDIDDKDFMKPYIKEIYKRLNK